MNDNDLFAALRDIGALPKSDAPYTEGSMDAEIAFVGEAPGEEEERQQQPFVGSAGRLFNTLLHNAVLRREAVRIENLFQFRPYQNNITPYLRFTKKEVIESAEFRYAQSALIERLTQSKARVIVPMGAPALYALTGKQGIHKWRGSVLTSDKLPNKYIIPTVHPAAALRQWGDQPLILHDFRRVKEWARGDKQLLKRSFQLEPTMEEILEYITRCNAASMVGFDIEVTRKHLSHLSLAISPTDCMSIPFYDRGREYFTVEQEATVLCELAKLFRNTDVIKLAHNAVFDAGFLYYRYGMPIRPLDDTMVASRIVQPDMPASLAFAVSIYCDGEPYYKDDGNKVWKLDPEELYKVDYKQFRHYNAMDSAVLMEIFPQLVADLKRQGNYETYRYQAALIEPLVYMQSKGIRINVPAMKQASADALTRINELELDLHKRVGFAMNANSPTQVMEYFYDTRGQSPYYKTVKKKDGTREKKKTVDVRALRRLSAKGFTEASIILEIRKLAKLRGTYYEMPLDEDGYMRCSYNPVGTRYGRISSSQTIFGTGANLLNQPKAMKKLMIPEPGNIFINIDLSQAEFVAVAYMWQVRRMIDAIESGTDVHKATASFIVNKPIELISDEEGSAEIGNGTMSERGLGKQANHAFNYGLGPEKFSMNNEIELSAARFIHAKYHAMYPEIKRAHNAIVERLNHQKIMTNVYGRKYYIMRRWGPDLFEAAYCFEPQSTVADKLNRDGFLPAYYDQESFKHASLANQVYDSIVFEFPIALIDQLQDICVKICDRLETPIPVHARTFVIHPDVSVGFNLGTMRKLKLKEVYDKPTFDAIMEEVIGSTTT